MFFSTLNLPVSGVLLGTANTDTTIGSVTPTLADTTAEWLYISDVTFPTGAITYNLEDTIATYTDVTDVTEATLVVEPFGTVATMDVGDGLFLHPYLSTVATTYSRIYVNVSTPGVGTYSIQVKRYNATTDTWDIQTITEDTTSAFTVAGTGYIDFVSNTHGATRLQQQDTQKEYWTQVSISSLTSVTTAPAIDALWLQTSGSGATIFGSSTALTYTIRPDNVFVTGNSYFLAISSTAPVGWNVTSKVADDIPVTWKWQYYNSSNVWTDLPTVRDETSGLSTAVTDAEVRWAIPADWTSTTWSMVSDTTGTTVTRTGYIHRIIPVDDTTTVDLAGGATVIYYVQLGSAYSSGIPINAGTIDYLTYDIRGTTSSTDVVLGLANSTAGTMSVATIAADRTSSFYDTNHKLDVTDLAFADDAELMVFHLAGGDLSDIELRLHTA